MFRLFRSLLDAVRAHCPTEILIVGNNGPSWAAALGPDAPVWRQLRLRATERPLRAGQLRRIVSIPLLEAHVPAVAPGTSTLLPPPEAMRVFADKGRFARYAAEQGLDAFVPATYASPDAARFPAVLKRCDLNAGNGVVVVASADELASRLTEAPWAGHAVLLQDCIEATVEYVAHLVRAGGRIVWSRAYAYPLAHARVVRGPVEGVAIEPAHLSAADLAVFERFLAPLAYQGPANIDFRRRADGRLAILEINPRLGGSLMRPEFSADLEAVLGIIVREAQPPRRAARVAQAS